MRILISLLLKTVLILAGYSLGSWFLGQQITTTGGVMCFLIALIWEVKQFLDFLKLMRNQDIAVITKIKSNTEVPAKEYQIIVENIEKTQNVKFKDAKCRRSYLLFGSYVYTIRFTKQTDNV